MSYDRVPEENHDADGLAELQRHKLDALWQEVMPRNMFYRHKYAGLSFDPLRDSLQLLPTMSRAEIQDDQYDQPPFGTNLTYAISRYCRYHQTSGTSGTPLRWLDTAQSWEWWKRCWDYVYRGAGLTRADRLVYPFSFGPFIGFWSAFESAAALGNLCLPAGGMSTLARLEYIRANNATVVCCTPTYALHMAQAAAEHGIELARGAVRALIVAGEPGGHIASTRRRIEEAWGARLFDHVGMTEVGAWGFECAEAPDSIHVTETEFIAEVIDPDTEQSVPEGEPGELVLTNLGRWGSPLIRYRTGDQVIMRRGRCACGRHFARLEGGVIGRIDDMLIVRGNNVFPSAIEGILRGFEAVAEFRVKVEESGAMNDLSIEVEPTPGVDGRRLAMEIAAAVRDRLYFTPRVTVVEPGTLPRFEMKARRVAKDRGSECAATGQEHP